jgi:hypothetical protein
LVASESIPRTSADQRVVDRRCHSEFRSLAALPHVAVERYAILSIRGERCLEGRLPGCSRADLPQGIRLVGEQPDLSANTAAAIFMASFLERTVAPPPAVDGRVDLMTVLPGDPQ